jgi:hypothetical protein
MYENFYNLYSFVILDLINEILTHGAAGYTFVVYDPDLEDEFVLKLIHYLLQIFFHFIFYKNVFGILIKECLNIFF